MAAGAARSSKSRRSRFGAHWLMARDFEQAINDGVELAGELIQTPQRGHGAFLDASSFITVGLDKLDIAARAGSGDFYQHATTL